MFYNCQRYYDPERGQYLSADPLGLAGGMHSHGYVENPLTWCDPLGLSGCEGNASGVAAANKMLALPAGRSAAEIRNSPGRVSGGLNFPNVIGRWFKGTDGNFGNIPGQIAQKLNGRIFQNFDEFRSAFWSEVAKDSNLASQFSRANVNRMTSGLAPIARTSQHLGKQTSYILHHKTPIQHGGSVYDLSNIIVTTPRLHKELLDGAYHYGGF